MGQTKELSTKEYFEILLRKKWIIFLSIIITIIIIYIFNSLMLPVFRATTTLLITGGGAQQSVLGDSKINPIFGSIETVETFIEILKSHNVAQGVAEKLPHGIFNKAQTEALREKKGNLKWPLSTLFNLYYNNNSPVSSEIIESNGNKDILEPMNITKEIIENVKNSTFVKTLKPTNIIEISCENNSPELAAQMANTTALVFMEQYNLINRSNASKTKEFIEEQLLQKENELSGLEEELKYFTDLRNNPEKEFQLARIERNMRVSENVYMLLLEKYQEARIDEVMEFRDIIIIDKANVPDKPVKPRKMLNLIIGGLFGIVLGCIIAFFLEFIDKTIKKPEDVERTLNLPVLGTIPKDN